MKQYQFTKSQDEERYSLIQKLIQAFCKIIATKVYLLRTLVTQSQILLFNQNAQAKRRLIRVQLEAELMFVKETQKTEKKHKQNLIQRVLQILKLLELIDAGTRDGFLYYFILLLKQYTSC
ncbi:Hypothetical_protein [Hexamita inflata]|uniref:Hypothetical_protein n=1 Tax=Hexamita inflata TaxID=28002 RepID=A0ABP1IK23_9EUKA